MDGVWILNAPGHRLEELGRMVADIAEMHLTSPELGEPIIADAGEEWVCDGCNGTVEVFHDSDRTGPDPTKLPPLGRLCPVPVLNGAVLCRRCFPARMPDGDLSPANRWPGCGCAACRSARC